jgi:chromosome segregation ATPase
VNEEDQYNFQSLSNRLNLMEKENEILRQRVANLQNENFVLKTDVYKIKIDLDDKSREVSDITLKIDNIQTSISAIDSEDKAVKRKTYASVVAGVDVGKEVDLDTLFVEQTQRMAKEKMWSSLALILIL